MAPSGRRGRGRCAVVNTASVRRLSMMRSGISAVGAARTAERTARGPGVELLARLGYAAKGLVYLIVGVLAVRVAIDDGGKTTDNRGALQTIYHQPFGQFLLGVTIAGLIGYALWSLIMRALFDA